MHDTLHGEPREILLNSLHHLYVYSRFTEIPLTVCVLSQLVPVSHSKKVLSLSCVAELRLQERKHSDVVFLFPGEFLTAQT